MKSKVPPSPEKWISYKRAKPLDLSFENLKSLTDFGQIRALSVGFVSSCRMLGLPAMFNGRYKTSSLLLNNNRLTGDLEGIRVLTAKLFHQPHALRWLDVSSNRLTDVPAELGCFPNLRTLYMHHNELASLCAVRRLSQVTGLRSLTLTNNPVAAVHGYRATVMFLLPQLISLDFAAVTNTERRCSLPPAWLLHAIKKS